LANKRITYKIKLIATCEFDFVIYILEKRLSVNYSYKEVSVFTTNPIC
jgi:hypothetical protein